MCPNKAVSKPIQIPSEKSVRSNSKSNRKTKTSSRTIRNAKDKELKITKKDAIGTEQYKKLRAARIADTRDKIDTTRYLKTLHEIDTELMQINGTLRDGVMVDGDGNVVTDLKSVKKGQRIYLVPRCSESDERHYKVRIMALDKRANHAFRMLNKVLPDLKAESVEDDKKEDPSTVLRKSLEMIAEKYN